MKLADIEDKEELIIDAKKLNTYNSTLCKEGLGKLLNQFIDGMRLDDEELRMLYRYNEFLKQNCRR